MSILFFTCFVLLLSAIAYQDFRYRRISLYIFILLLGSIALALYFSYISGIANSFKNIIVNVGFVVALLIGVKGYFILRRGSFVNIMDHYIGRGDIVFLFIVSGLFSPVNFILFCIAGFSASIIVFGTIQLFRPEVNREIPLAGILSIVLLLGLSYRYVDRDFNLQEDSLFLKQFSLFW